MSTSKARISSTPPPRPLRAPGPAPVQAKDVDDPPAHRHLPRRGHRGHPPVAEAHEAPQHRVAPDPLAAAQLTGGGEGLDREGGAEQPGRGGDDQGGLGAAEQGEGGDAAAGHLLGRGDPVEPRGVRRRPEAEAGFAAPEAGVGVDGLGIGGDHQDVAGGATPRPPGDQPGGARGHASEGAQRARRESGEGGDAVETGGEGGGAVGRRLNHRGASPRHRPEGAGAAGCTRSWRVPGRRARSPGWRRRRVRGSRAGPRAPLP